ncbi:protein required for actin cytoskeleton organization and cell cycle progression [Coprinopsis marcescibilis]|uniref:Protein SDA1 n=1 Tax=Coprinopsis marcescibilis TaxID=230819 RepID=A0A5C3KXF1_COPMA|nr:protein required for actin cytoskeleton organization and cell cycle progression [Coprinopsis marcescibilis]
MVRGILLTSNLPQLQNLIKRDPESYKEEFLQQWNHYNSIREIFGTNPGEQAEHFRELVTFISQVATCYPKETAGFPTQLSDLLLTHYLVLPVDTRKTLVTNLVMLRNKNVITSIDLMKTLFPLLPQTPSPTLRAFIRKTIISDIRLANVKTQNHKLNNSVQAMLFNMVERGMDGEMTGNKGKTKIVPSTGVRSTNDEAMWAIIMAKELWKKGIWKDAKTVSIIAQGCLHPSVKVQSASLHFFLNDEEEPNSDEEGDEEVDVRSLHHQRQINKKTRSGDKKLQKKLTHAKKKKYNKPEALAEFSALRLLRDPQTFAEKLFDLLHHHDKKFDLDHRILIMQLLSRIMGSHQLCVLNFYTYVIKYLFHKQLRVPSILVALAQSVHDLTPPDVLTPVIRKIAQDFVHPGVANEVIAAGINSVREVCQRQPWAMEEDLLHDLVEYRKSRDKAVLASARGLLRLYREVNPGMLKKNDRGKEATMGIASGAKALPFGHAASAAMDIDGLTLLEDHLRETGGGEDGSDDDSYAWNKWEVESDSDESESESEGWVDVSDGDSKALDISDSEDEDEPKEPKPEIDPKRLSILATTKILTPADFALLNSLKASNSESTTASAARNKRKLDSEPASNSQFLSEQDILGPRKKAKADYEERMASVRAGREGREKFGSRKGKQNKAAPSSTTNREKARNKPIMMIMGSDAVRGKKKASLRDKQQKLRAHIRKGKISKH